MVDSSPFRYDKADSSPGFLLWKLTALWHTKLNTILGEFGITQTQYALLASLKWFKEKKEPTTQSHLVSHTKIDKMTVSKALRRLEKAGLVTRENSSIDNRATDVQFTDRGEKEIQKAIMVIERADDAFFSSLSKKQLEKYKELTSIVIAENEGSRKVK